ncbi:nuclear transport factor 2 family protein [Aetokthonos hydrillicola Thurmond2011]|jgi:ketosteroid isomerase-like protein|uniref:Nuclear transport factor 2 family protein n=1 Tax=Aetokthonos hydrillicola Thurmond2011 TaxID=2712845 RepID=A0AAP5IHU8_9CYAN|nr:nuclear transport factor 2 family protein [Aetokthonos hydrillicola]MBO3457914.1 nuclear transport factor 2 family protein [Aetokthonos hydrillicola CCALA 1050]MBW4587401.1 nuclear transport factor 2 family protein [Aetokthonos hydrillicola CCALA 1050]MDR9899970.1 nuclear transport factor 2 family protein [Aetokthonos hydrillicola Thurmond2011]
MEADNTLKVGHEAFKYFTDGLATGEWDLFLNMLTEDFSFWFPIGKFHGLNVGKDKAQAFFQYVSECFEGGLTLTLDRVTSNQTTVVFEFRDEGTFLGKPYKNRIAVSFDVREDKICGYREYLGSDGESN